jgi:hypothetical protein
VGTLLYETGSHNALARATRSKEDATLQEQQTAQRPLQPTINATLSGKGVVEPLEGPSVVQLSGSDPQQIVEGDTNCHGSNGKRSLRLYS